MKLCSIINNFTRDSIEHLRRYSDYQGLLVISDRICAKFEQIFLNCHLQPKVPFLYEAQTHFTMSFIPQLFVPSAILFNFALQKMTAMIMPKCKLIFMNKQLDFVLPNKFNPYLNHNNFHPF